MLINYVYMNNPALTCSLQADVDLYDGITCRDAARHVAYLWVLMGSMTCPTTFPPYVPTLRAADTLWIPTDTLTANQSSIMVTLQYKNSVGQISFACPFKIRIGGTIPTIDSVLAGGKLNDYQNEWERIDTASGTILLGGLRTPSSGTPIGAGVLAYVYMHTPAVGYPRAVEIDTTQLAPFNYPMFVDCPTVSDTSLTSVIPNFVGVTSLTTGFTPTVTTDTADVFYVRQADMDMDNNGDFVFTGSTADSLYIAYGKSGGSLENSRGYFRVGKAALSVDYLNGDTLLDIAARSTTQVYVLLNSGNRNFSIDSFPLSSMAFHRGPASAGFPSISSGYFNGDAAKDLVVSPGTVFFGNGSGGFPSNSTLSFTFDAVAASDFNQDGIDDMVASIGDSAKIFLNNGAGVMSRSAAVRIGYHPFDVSTMVSGVDFNKDGRADFVVVTGQSVLGPNDTSLVTIGLGNGSGGVQSHDTLRILGSAINLAIGDVDRNHSLDISVLNARTRTLEIYLGNGLGGFPDSTSTVLGTSAQALLTVASADLNRDGNPDFVSGGGNTPIVTAENQSPPDPVLPAEMVVTGYGGIDFTVQNPLSHVISQYLQTVAGSAFWRADIDHDNTLDERSFDYNLLNGEYKIIIRFPPYYGGGPFTMDIRVDGSQQIRPFLGYALPTMLRANPEATDSLVYYYTQETISSMSPANGRKTRSQTPVFQWGKLVDTVSSSKYHLQTSFLYDFSSLILSDSTLTKPQYLPSSALDTGKVYYWRARSFSGTWSAWTRTMAAHIGPGCCQGFSGNVNLLGIVDGADLALLVSYLTISGITLPCADEANVNSLGIVDGADLASLVSYLTGGGYALPSCP